MDIVKYTNITTFFIVLVLPSTRKCTCRLCKKVHWDNGLWSGLSALLVLLYLLFLPFPDANLNDSATCSFSISIIDSLTMSLSTTDCVCLRQAIVIPFKLFAEKLLDATVLHKLLLTHHYNLLGNVHQQHLYNLKQFTSQFFSSITSINLFFSASHLA